MKKSKCVSLATLLLNCNPVTMPVVAPILAPDGTEILVEESVYVKKAMAVWNNDRFTIYYNPGWMRFRVHPDAQTFVLFHEIGHIQQGHLGENVYLSKQQKVDSEIEADCYAGLILKNNYHYNKEQLENVVEFLKDEMRDLDRADKFKRCVG
ncbi:MAG: hypothetical protein Q7K45_01885 [Nanoarchaeota archaeon]|nr:hypothetical protein [Nanoarchaeota archaeon]